MTKNLILSVDSPRSLACMAIIGSLALSLLAFITDPVLNRDGMLYIDLARQIAVGETQGSITNTFNWPFFSYFLAGIIKVSPFSALISVTIVVSLFAAGATALMALLLSRVSLTSGWLLLLFVLALPALNEYRSSVLRDWPGWFFSLLAIYAWLRYMEKASVGWLSLCFGAIVFGVLCRLEIGVVAIGLALAGLLMPERNWRKLAGFYVIPVVGVTALLFFLVFDGGEASDRIFRYANALNMAVRYQEFQHYGDLLAGAVLNEFSEDYGSQVLFWGLMTLIPSKLLMLLGWLILAVFLKPVDWKGGDRTTYQVLFCLWLAVLVVFLVTNLFLSSRYVVFLALMLLPFLWGRFSQAYVNGSAGFRRVSVMILIVSALATSISTTGHEKTALRQAGGWLAERSERVVYINDGQVSFYAGQGYFSDDAKPLFPEQVIPGSLLAWRVERDEQDRLLALQEPRFSLEKVFDSSGNSVVVVLVRK
ncbi:MULTISPECIES: glycosyltransferase family 39 protein [unclassified Alcanivorax]|uniref:glycosyltransferase family 39 protein n=1 Tax=unclassified Alcanivorax TaxID=2638842 RepID=UPI000AC87240|nr:MULTISPECIES: glycosyltransferase family 39 protein [unclassified Alcanivorax]